MIVPFTTKLHDKYFVKGKRVPGASTIAKVAQDCKALMGWVAEVTQDGQDWEKMGDEQARIGEVAHALFQGYVTGEQVDLSRVSARDIVLARQSADQAISFWLREGLQLVAAEEKLVSQKGYGGLIDVIGRRPETGNLVLVDWKRTNNLYETHLIQVAGGYEPMWNENHPDDLITERFIIRLGKLGVCDFSERMVEDWEQKQLENMFDDRLNVYKNNKIWEKSHEK